MSDTGLRQRLIIEGINEINQSGIQNLSVRRIASNCGVSCAAPYKHFKTKDDFIDSITEYIRDLWIQHQLRILELYPDNTRKQIVEICVEYVRFMIENPHYRAVISYQSRSYSQINYQIKGSLGGITHQLIDKYSQEEGLTVEQARNKTYMVRTLLLGSTAMFDLGELEYTDENLKKVSDFIDRAFDF
jgi:AcrR family transcriptional regulator